MRPTWHGLLRHTDSVEKSACTLRPARSAAAAEVTLVTVGLATAVLLGSLFGLVLAGSVPRRWTAWIAWRGAADATRRPDPAAEDGHSLRDLGAPSRAACIELLWTALEHTAHSQRRLAVLVLDCDRFNLINDAYGFAVGDLVLHETARRIRRAAPARHRLLRAGGDEFLLVVEGMADPQVPLAIAQSLVDAFNEPLDVSGQPIYTGVSIGIALSPEHGARPEALLGAAECGLREAKKAGRRTARMYDPQIGAREARRAHALQRLHAAFAEGDLLLHYQPKVNLANGTCIGFEALLRLRTPDGLEGPGALIEAAERSGFISRLGEWVLQEAATQRRLWREEGIDVPIAVNLSTKQLQDPHFLDFMQAQLVLDPQMPQTLQLEITESALAVDYLELSGVLQRLRQMGFQVQVDHFGTGYSTMGFLSKLSIDTLKIDRSFIAGLPNAMDSQRIVRAIVGMAHDLGMRVVAEGVETEPQAQWLQRMGCDHGQGFFFARAMPSAQAAAFAQDNVNLGPVWAGPGAARIPTGEARSEYLPLNELATSAEREPLA